MIELEVAFFVYLYAVHLHYLEMEQSISDRDFEDITTMIAEPYLESFQPFEAPTWNKIVREQPKK